MAGGEKSGLCVPYTIHVMPEKGRGVFAGAPISEGTIVWRHVPGNYSVYDEKSLKDLLASLSHSAAVYELTHIFGLPEFPGYMIRVLDDGVLINHSHQPTVGMNNVSREHEVPAVKSVKGATAALMDDRFALIAIQDLKIGEELTHDYNADVEDPKYYDALCEHYGVSWDWL